MRGVTALALLLSASPLSLAAPAQTFETIQTENGPITGHRAAKAAEVWEYLGIPYAQPPLGSLRFAAPQKYSGQGPYNASQFGFDCPQTTSGQVDFPGFTPQASRIIKYFTGGAGTERSEDCLTLNVWSKPTAKSEKTQKPVYVLFYGGRFAGGNTNTAFSNGQYFANAQDIVVVTVNYRVNVFGFPGAPGADTNLGLRDQRMAVEWVRKNIAAFGGSPDKIVISGQSSGGVSVDWWSYAYKENPIVHGLMSTSGTGFSFPMNSPERQEQNWYTLSAALGCGSSGETIECMRQKPWEDISAAVAKIAPSPGGSPIRTTPPFFPKVDGEIVFDDYLTLSSGHQFAKIPYFHGHNDHEQGYYNITAYGQGRQVTPEQGDQFLLESFVCPHSYEANRRQEANVPTWVYRYFGEFDNTRLYPTSGAYHGIELHAILGGSEDASGLPETQAQKDTVKLFQNAVAAFAENPKSGLSRKLGWPQFNPKSKSWIEIAVGSKSKATFALPEKYDAPCSTIVMGSLPTLA